MEHETAKQDTSCLAQPLTRRNTDGQVYQRLAVVDRQINEALGLGDEELRSRLEIRDEKSPAFLKEESLVYLIRHHHGAGNRDLVNVLAECVKGGEKLGQWGGADSRRFWTYFSRDV